jgi:putative GTP pyrophosphokinase
MGQESERSPLLDDFRIKADLYESLAKAMDSLLHQLADSHNVEVFQIQRRIKTAESLEEKITRPDKAGKYEALEDITDLCGLRVITYGNEDCAKMISAIRSEFYIDEANSIDKNFAQRDDQFGYLSVHLVVALSDSRKGLFKFSRLAGLKAEIQVRTVLQHAWASLDWKLRYKSEIEVPRELRRKLYRVNALLEAADDTFSDIQREADSLRAKYSRNVEAGTLGIEINKDSLEEFIKNSPTVKKVWETCGTRGIKISHRSMEKKGPWNYLIRSLAECKIVSLEQLEAALQSLTKENYDDLEGVAKLLPKGVTFGIFTPIRILAISQLSREEQENIFVSYPNNLKSGKATEQYFLSTK